MPERAAERPDGAPPADDRRPFRRDDRDDRRDRGAQRDRSENRGRGGPDRRFERDRSGGRTADRPPGRGAPRPGRTPDREDSAQRLPEPSLGEEITAGQLDAEARRDLRGLQKDLADRVARHLVAAGMLVDDDPEQALAHTRYARQKASRIAVVREAAGITAYHAGEWAEALGELRAARRMGGGPAHLAVMADIERALGRPERALELTRSPEARELPRAEAIELAIVAAGARRDLGELDVAVVGLQIPELDPARREPWSARLFYAYADNLLAAGRAAEALQWFVHAADADDDGVTDAGLRIAELTGEPLPDDVVEFSVEDEPAGAMPDAGPDDEPVAAEPSTPPGPAESTPDPDSTAAAAAAGEPASEEDSEPSTSASDR